MRRDQPAGSAASTARDRRGFGLRIVLGAMVVLPVLAIVAVILSQRQTGAPQRPPALQVQATAVPTRTIAARWQATTLKAETDGLVVDPLRPNHLYAGTTMGIWESEDTGATWKRNTIPGTSPGFFSLAAASTGNQFYGGAGDGTIFARGSQQGTWHRIVSNLDGSPVFCLAIVPGTTPVLLAGTTNAIYRITFQAKIWHTQRVMNTGGSSVTSIAVLPWQPQVAYASIFGQAPPVLQSVDGGRHWHAYSQGLPPSLPSEQLLPVSALSKAVVLSSMGGGVWQLSTDSKWSEITAGLPERHAMPLAARDSAGLQLYAGTMGMGVFTKASAKLPWQLIGKQLANPAYIDLSLQVAGSPRAYLVVGTSVGVFRQPLP